MTEDFNQSYYNLLDGTTRTSKICMNCCAGSNRNTSAKTLKSIGKRMLLQAKDPQMRQLVLAGALSCVIEPDQFAFCAALHAVASGSVVYKRMCCPCCEEVVIPQGRVWKEADIKFFSASESAEAKVIVVAVLSADSRCRSSARRNAFARRACSRANHQRLTNRPSSAKPCVHAAAPTSCAPSVRRTSSRRRDRRRGLR